MPAPAFEAAVAGIVTEHLADYARRHTVLAVANAAASQAASETIAALAGRINAQGIALAASLVGTGQIGGDRLRIELDRGTVASSASLTETDLDPSMLSIDVPFACRRRGVEMKIVAGDRSAVPDVTLLRALRNAHHWSKALRSGMCLRELARKEAVSPRYVARILPLYGLAPKIQAAIVDGTQPVDLTLQRLKCHPFPLDWSEQERLLGFGG